MCFGCSKEPSHRDGSFEYPQHMFWLRNKKNNFQLRTLIWGPAHVVRKSDFVVFELKGANHLKSACASTSLISIFVICFLEHSCIIYWAP